MIDLQIISLILKNMSDPDLIKKKYWSSPEIFPQHTSNFPTSDSASPLDSGSPIPYAGRVFNDDEVVAAVSSTLDFWLTLSFEGSAMEDTLSSFLGIRRSLLVNSGSSANLIAISIFTSGRL